MSRPDEDGFLGRWSAKKRGLVEEPERVEEAPADAAPQKTDAEILEELDLPDPDSLKPGDDFSKFMVDAVPAHLRTRALRKLWVSNPVLANLDELLDYGDDFTDAATVVENMQTAYKAGRGFLKDIVEDEENAPPDAESDGETVAAVDDPSRPDGVPSDEIDTEVTLDAGAQQLDGPAADPVQPLHTTTENGPEGALETVYARRMRFVVKDA